MVLDAYERLVVVSNRTPTGIEGGATRSEGQRTAGGLVSALYPALQKRGGLWFGWSGRATRRQAHAPPHLVRHGGIQFATIDLSEEEINDFYAGFCNRALWPLFHCFPSRVRLRREEYRAYRRVNRTFATQLFPLLKAGDAVWVHDYHLIPLGTELRRLGWKGRLGFFLHTPFPPVDILTILPFASQLLADLNAYEVLGFHTQRYRQNCVDALCSELGGTFDGQAYHSEGGAVRCGVYAIGTDPTTFARWAMSTQAEMQSKRLRRSVRGRRIVLGVDRLDYTKGIPERLLAFERLLERYPAWQRRVSLIQISAPSRTRVPEYIEQKREVDRLVGAINGRFSEEDWVPIRYLYRTYSQEELAAFYREADVCIVTPLRDGMNLVAKEYVASQTADPGVLVLSRFCGAAEELREAVIVNPYDVDGMADDLKRALEMPLAERQERWQALIKRVCAVTAQTWCEQFLADLTSAP
ncbi:MAG: alpha,alpha-trehalose-phosphate synthase (UDP-forming) [Candidatus Binatia bacterium]|nr:alpha,alpha-trehalose-phosphate synthase (UDP-forming) [Candidatus Binatia bacterium]